jgi:hypothetical protein
MSKKGFDKPIVNISSLISGTLELVHSDVLNQPILNWQVKNTYNQSVTEIIDLLESVDHYIIGRLEEDDLKHLGWSRADELTFYHYLNHKFYIIEGGRRNLFEHVLSKATRTETPKELSQPQSRTVAKETIIKLCNVYKSFKEWCLEHFDVASYYYYEDYIHNPDSIEEYILNLDFMQDNPNGTWKDMFGQTFAEFNTYHNLIRPRENLSQDRNITYNASAALPELRNQYLALKGDDWPDIDEIQDQELPESITQDSIAINNNLLILKNNNIVSVSKTGSKFLTNNRHIYLHTINQLKTLDGTGLMSTQGIPVKRQTLIQKIRHIKNINEVISWYNSWVKINNLGEVYTYDSLLKLAAKEEKVSEDIMYKSNINMLDNSNINIAPPLLTLLTSSTENKIK